MPIATTRRLVLRNWEEKDRDLFHEINSDPVVMEFFPFLRTRAQSDELFERIRGIIAETGLGFYALAERESDIALGFCGLSRTTDRLEPHLPAGTVEIGWRLARRHWGRGYVTEAAERLLAYGFEEKGLAEIVSFAVAGNTRSIAVMRRIGMRAAPERNFDMPGLDDPTLRPHVLYTLDRAGWQSR
ncbi:GNAT family N-acetyltransferase [Shinella sp.]|uniref:GNAT family N-acetyltransferase n=1 Tax=Shinella sp. TaxID=1870904 RepID=UPI0025898881|nr:GNAT family N-acetyltransferase [Shinella sp.]MCW5706460.1 GNAT family N-acetyltransferase [Shinella sp.]